MTTLLVAILYLFLLFFTIAFQIGLVAGKPWGEWTMGGYQKGALPPKLRVGAGISILILSFFSLVVMNKVNLFSVNLGFPSWIKFVILAFNVLAVFANTITRSKKERLLWQPITAGMLICSVYLFI